MTQNRMASIALFLAILALGVAVLRTRPPSRSVAATGPEDPALGQRLAAIEARIDDLTGLAPPSSVDSTPSLRTPVTSGDAPGDLGQRLALLEERTGRLELRAWTLGDLQEHGYRVLRLGYDEATLIAWTDQARDPEATEQERLEAFQNLRGQLRDDTTDARLPVLQDMLELAFSSDDPELRAAIYRDLSGLSEPRLIRPLVDSMRGDSSPAVRGAAARALGAFRSDPDVQAALELVLDQDPDELVKDAAFEGRYGQLRRPMAETREQ